MAARRLSTASKVSRIIQLGGGALPSQAGRAGGMCQCGQQADLRHPATAAVSIQRASPIVQDVRHFNLFFKYQSGETSTIPGVFSDHVIVAGRRNRRHRRRAACRPQTIRWPQEPGRPNIAVRAVGEASQDARCSTSTPTTPISDGSALAKISTRTRRERWES